MRSIAFTRDCTWRALVALARKRSMKRSIRSISACCLSIARPSWSSRAAASRRQACQEPGKKRERPASSSSTEVPTASRNQRSWATSTTAASRPVEVALEPLERGDVEVVGGLVEEQQVGVARERARERRARELAAREAVEPAVEGVVGEAQAVERAERPRPPVPAARVLEPRLGLGVAVEQGVRRRGARPSPPRARPAAARAPPARRSPRARSRAARASRSRGGRWSWSASRVPLASTSSPPSMPVSPASILSSVVLPAPLRPASVMRSRRSSLNETSRNSGAPAMSLSSADAITTAMTAFEASPSRSSHGRVERSHGGRHAGGVVPS